jgi:hypothetical protein
MEVVMPQIPLETRLHAFKLSTETVKPVDLNVSPNQQVVLDTSNTTFKSSLTYLTPQTLDDVKAWLGTPNSAFARAPVAANPGAPPIAVAPTRVAHPTTLPPTVLQPSATHSVRDIEQLHSLTRSFVFGNSETVSASQLPALNAWIAGLKIKLPIFVFANITVAAGAVLHVNVNALFANYITVENTGQIKLRGGTKTAIHAAGFTGKGSHIVVHPITDPVVARQPH